jgi:hypothetical protein
MTNKTITSVELHLSPQSPRKQIKAVGGKCAVADCENPVAGHAEISINNGPRKRQALCEWHIQAALEDKP